MRNDTDIIKGLNLNKDPKGVPNGSLIFAKNIKLDDDGVNLTNEEGFIEALGVDVNGEKLKGHIVGTITCNKEIVLFTYNYSTKQSYIYRAQEVDNEDKLKLIPVKTAWKWSGGVIHGTYTYNVNGELIVCIGEYSKNSNVPIYNINLDTSSENDNINSYSSNPNIPIANLKFLGYIPGINIPNGVYYFYIRYKIYEDYYTKWKPIGNPIYALKEEVETIIEHKFNTKDNSINSTTPLSATYNHPLQESNYGLELEVTIDNNYNYEECQIGYILNNEESTLARIWRNFKIEDKHLNITFDGKYKEKTNVDDLNDNVVGLYNVGCLIDYDNRIYISNYSETDYNVDLQQYANSIKAKVVFKNYNKDTNTVTTTLYKFEYNDNVVQIRTNYSRIKLINYPALYKLLLYHITFIGEDKETYKFSSNHGPNVTDYVSVADAYINLTTSNLQIETESGKVIIASGNDGYVMNKNQAKYSSFNASGVKITKDVTTNTYIQSTFVRTLLPLNVYNFFIHYVREDGTYTNGLKIPNHNSIDDRLTIQLKNGNNGSVTNKLKDISEIDYNSGDDSDSVTIPHILNVDDWKEKYLYEFISSQLYNNGEDVPFGYYENTNGDTLFKTPYAVNNNNHYCIGCGFSNIIIPKGYIGFFISYEEPDNIVKYETLKSDGADGLFRASDVETGQVHYGGNIYYPIKDKMFPTPFHIINSKIYASNTMSVINDHANSTIGTNGGISLDININNEDKYSPANNEKALVAVINRNIYSQKNKVLIKLGPVVYGNTGVAYEYTDSNNTIINHDNSYNLARGYDFNYPSFYCTDKHLIYNYRIYITDTGAEVKGMDADGNMGSDNIDTSKKDYGKIISYNKYSSINLNAISIKKTPELVVSVLKTTNDQANITKLNIVTKPINATDLIEYKHTYIENNNKFYTNYNSTYKYIYTNELKIRRSNVFSDESTYNSWRDFPTDGYKIINKNNGKIKNIFGVANNFYIHTEHTILCINKDNTLKAQNTEVQLATRDLFEGEPVEVLIGNHGFGGLQTQDSWCFNHLGYFFFDKDSKRIYLFNDNQLTDLSIDIIALLNNITIDNAYLETDFVNDRVLVCIQFHTDKVTKDYITLSYSLKSKKWLSLHDYYFSRCLNTKNKCYFWGNDYAVANQLFTLSKTANIGDYNSLLNNCFLFPESHIVNEEKIVQSAIFDVIFNNDYLTSKSIDNINYIVNKVFDYADELITRMAEPSMENNTFGDKNHYAGDLLRIYTDSNDTGNIDISLNNEVNQYNDYKKPHYNNGYWQFNYFRNAIIIAATEKQLLRRLGVKDKSQLTAEQQAKFDESLKKYIPNDNRNLIYGRYFVVRFIFNNVDNIPFRFETLSINYNAY